MKITRMAGFWSTLYFGFNASAGVPTGTAPELPKIFISPNAPGIVMLGQQRVVGATMLYGGSRETEIVEAIVQIAVERRTESSPAEGRISRVLVADRENIYGAAVVSGMTETGGTGTANLVCSGAVIPPAPAVKELFLLADIPRGLETGDRVTTVLIALRVREQRIEVIPADPGPTYGPYGQGGVWVLLPSRPYPVTNVIRGPLITLEPPFPARNTAIVQGLRARLFGVAVTREPVLSATISGSALEGSIVRIQCSRDLLYWENLRTNWVGIGGKLSESIPLTPDYRRRGFFRVETLFADP